MKRSPFLITLAVTLVALAIALLFPPQQAPQGPAWLPWQIERVDGTIRVFGMTLGRTSVAEAQTHLGEEAEVSLFAGREGGYAVEAYFDDVSLGGLRAKVVATVALSEAEEAQMFERGVRISTMGSGERKVTLHPDDLGFIMRSPIATLTYLPRVNLEEELLRKRFGEPAERLVEEDGVVHLLYPDEGLDIAISGEEKEVFQYVPPAEFERLMAPLRETGSPRTERTPGS